MRVHVRVCVCVCVCACVCVCVHVCPFGLSNNRVCVYMFFVCVHKHNILYHIPFGIYLYYISYVVI